METNFIIRPRSRKRRRRKKEMTIKVIPRTAASGTPLLAITKMWPKYNLLRIKYMMMNLIMKLINYIIIRIQKNKIQIIPRPIRIQNVIEQFRKAHIFLVRILHFIVWILFFLLFWSLTAIRPDLTCISKIASKLKKGKHIVYFQTFHKMFCID